MPQRPSIQRFTTVSIGILILLLFFAVLQWFFPQIFSFPRELFWHTTAPIQNSLIREDTDMSYDDVLQAYTTTKAALHNSVFDYIAYQDLQEENTNLRQALQFATSTGYTLVGADVLGKTKIGQTNLFVINRGSRHGLVAGQAVIIGDGVLVGLVSSVDLTTAYIVPIQENTTTLSARILTKEGRLHGVVEGIPGVATRLNLIPKDITFTIGDIIVTSGLDMMIPANLYIGTIDAIMPTPNEFFQSASLLFTGNYETHTTVFVVVP